MKKRNRIPLIILMGTILILGGVVLLRQSVHARMYAHKVVNMLSGIDSSAIAMEGGDQSSFFQRIEQLEEALLLTRKHYYKDVEMDKMLEGAIRGAVASLDDPYSVKKRTCSRANSADSASTSGRRTRAGILSSRSAPSFLTSRPASPVFKLATSSLKSKANRLSSAGRTA